MIIGIALAILGTAASWTSTTESLRWKRVTSITDALCTSPFLLLQASIVKRSWAFGSTGTGTCRIPEGFCMTSQVALQSACIFVYSGRRR
jgi:hypothetical protein